MDPYYGKGTIIVWVIILVTVLLGARIENYIFLYI